MKLDAFVQSKHDVLRDVQTGDNAILLGDDPATQRSACGHNRVGSDIAGSDVLFERTFYVVGDFERQF